MKFSEYSFPHPVLGLGNDVAGHIRVSDPQISEDSESYTISLTYDLSNSDLESLLDQKKIEFTCELTCSATLYRTCQSTSSLNQTFSISKKDVRDRVSLLFLLVAKEEIPEYKNSTSHTDFDGFSFDLDTGDILAYIQEFDFMANIKFLKMTSASSFMEIIPSERENGDMIVHLDDAKIQVELSKKDYQLFSDVRIGRNSDYASIFHASIVLPALTYALSQLPAQPRDFGTAWSELISFRLENDESLKNIQFEPENILSIAQKLIGMPIERLMDDLRNVSTKSNEEEY